MANRSEADEEDSIQDEGERSLHGSTLVPFPSELRNCRLKLAKCRRMGDDEQEALAQLDMAELQLHSARYGRALTSASAAFELSQRAAGQAIYTLYVRSLGCH